MGAHRASLKAETPEKTLMEQQKKKKKSGDACQTPKHCVGEAEAAESHKW